MSAGAVPVQCDAEALTIGATVGRFKARVPPNSDA